GLKSQGSQAWTQDSPGVLSTPDQFDRFGFSLGAGDFNNDGFDDLAVGVLGEEVAGLLAGAVHVLYGSDQGLTAAGDQLWSLGTTGVAGDPTPNGYYGNSLATGNFGNGPADDLAVGAPGQHVDLNEYAGGLSVLYGSGDGLEAAGSLYVTQATDQMDGDPDLNDFFAWSLAAGDFGGSDKDDLAVGVPGDEVLGPKAGSVHILFGSNQGVESTGSQYINETTAGIVEKWGPNAGDNFGWALAAGNFRDSSRTDLAIGVPGKDINGDDSAGGVVVVSGDDDGLNSTTAQFLSEDHNQAPGETEPSEAYGSVLTAANFGRTNRSDLAIAVPYNDVDGIESVGLVHVVYGSNNGFEEGADEIWHTAKPSIRQSPHQNEQFGSSLTGANFGKSSQADLAIGAPIDSVGGDVGAGIVNCIYGKANGLKAKDNQIWHQDKAGIPGQAEEQDFFGDGTPLVFA
ncbi:MAG TPA: FG-GAP repeat protein, partial [Actinomycetota bacterium]|nr:FG-GAP repeat protein [Actinomycetota bacterium]